MKCKFMVALYAFYVYVACSLADGFFGAVYIDKLLKGRTKYQKDITIEDSPLRRYFSTFLDTGPVVPSLSTLLDDGPVPVGDREFLINGWRWHTASVIRDLNRFEKVLIESKRGKTDVERTLARERIMKGYMFVFDFNWKACMKVEREIFFPWLQTLLPSSSNYLFNDVYEKHDSIKRMSSNLRNTCMNFGWDDDKSYRTALGLLRELKDCAIFIQNAQENVFVPFISAYVEKKDQEKFNNRVIRNLGLLDSQVHLVSMKEAINGNKKEENLFKNQIPYVARKLIPVWRKRLYQPRAKWLDNFKSYGQVAWGLEGGFVGSNKSSDDTYDVQNSNDEYPTMQLEEKEFIGRYFPEECE